MSNITDNMQPVDPKLIEKIELMRSTPERDPQSVTQGRDRFLAELDGIPVNGSRSPLAWLSGLTNRNFNQREENSMNTKSQKFAFSTIIAIIIVVVMLFGGASATAYASQSALPGDALYPLKTSLEQTQVALARDAYSQAQIYMQFAQNRLDEIGDLLQEGRYSDVQVASGEFEYNIQQAIVALQTVIDSDPERGAVLGQEISQALLDYALTLKTVLVNIPDPVKPSVEKALLVSETEAGEGLELIGVVLTATDSSMELMDYPYPIIISELSEIEGAINSGDTVKVHLIITADGTRIAREIELANAGDLESSTDDSSGTDDGEDDSLNDNLNENENSDDGNSNDDYSDDNQSDDSNENSDDDDSDLNDNDDDTGGDDNSSNDDDHSGNNDNSSNDNEDDNSSNDNEDDNSSNDNEDDNSSNDNEDDNSSNDNEDDNSGANDNDDDEKDESNDNDDAGAENSNDSVSNDD